MTSKQWVPIKIAILTVSDSRTEADDTSGDALVERLTQAGTYTGRETDSA